MYVHCVQSLPSYKWVPDVNWESMHASHTGEGLGGTTSSGMVWLLSGH